MSDSTISAVAGGATSPDMEWQPRLSEASGDRYELQRPLGLGGMATVFRARDHRLGRTVAVKILHRHLIDDTEHCARFRREAESIARLDHPGIVSIFDLLEIPGEFLAIILEYVDGPGLDEVLDESPPLPPELAAELGIGLLDALEHAHDHGVIHRDLKPANILVDGTSFRLTDFGIAHVVDKSTLTQTGSVLGSPHFMSPEMAEGQSVDARADLFSLGSILYLMVTGRRPFDAKSTPGVLRNIAEGRRPRADYAQESVGRDFASTLERFLAIDTDDRPGDADTARRILDEFVADSLDNRPDPAAWIEDPERYTSELNEEIEVALRRLARRAVDEGERRRALSAVERLLAIVPGDDEANELLDDLHDDRMSRRTLVTAALVFTVVAALGGLFAVYPASEGDEPGRLTEPPASQPEADGDDESQAPVAEQAQAEALEAAAEVASQTDYKALHAAEAFSTGDSSTDNIAEGESNDTASPSGDTSSQADDAAAQEGAPPQQSEADVDESPLEDDGETLYLVRFQLVPASATLTVDGEEFGAMEASRGLDLLQGTHDIIAAGPATEPYRRTIEVGPDHHASHSIVLSWKDGYIRLKVDRDALVWVDGEQTPHRIDGGHAETITIPFGRADDVANERDVDLRFAARDDLEVSHEETVRVRPDTETPVAVTLHEN